MDKQNTTTIEPDFQKDQNRIIRAAIFVAQQTQENRILGALEAAWPNWVPSPELAKISLQYNSRIFSLRRKSWPVSSRIEIVGGVRHGSFRLGSRPVPSSRLLRKSASMRAQPADPAGGKDTFPEFGNVTPERRYPD